MSFEIVTSGGIIVRAGSAVDTSIINNGGSMAIIADAAQGSISAYTRTNWATESLSTYGRQAVKDAMESYGANLLIGYNSSGFNSKAESQVLMDLNRDNYERFIRFIKEEKGKDALKA